MRGIKFKKERKYVKFITYREDYPPCNGADLPDCSG
jgi:hypothetical protein